MTLLVQFTYKLQKIVTTLEYSIDGHDLIF